MQEDKTSDYCSPALEPVLFFSSKYCEINSKCASNESRELFEKIFDCNARSYDFKPFSTQPSIHVAFTALSAKDLAGSLETFFEMKKKPAEKTAKKLLDFYEQALWQKQGRYKLPSDEVIKQAEINIWENDVIRRKGKGLENPANFNVPLMQSQILAKVLLMLSVYEKTGTPPKYNWSNDKSMKGYVDQKGQVRSDVIKAFNELYQTRKKVFHENLRTRAAALLGQGEIRLAFLCAQGAYFHNPSDEETLQLCVRSGGSGAEQFSKKLLDVAPRSDVAWTIAAEFYLLRDTGKSIYCADMAIDLNPRNSLAWKNRGEARILEERYDDGIADLTRALQLSPGDKSLKIALENGRKKKDEADENALMDLFLKYFRDGKYLDAISSADKLLCLNSKNSRVLEVRGVAKQMLGDYEEAIQDLDVAIKLNTNSSFAWMHRGEIKLILKRYEEAILDLSQTIKLDAKDDSAKKLLLEAKKASMEGWKQQAQVHYVGGEYAKALTYYDKLLDVDSSDVSTLVGRSKAKRKLNRYDEAIQDLSKAKELEPDNNDFKEEFVSAYSEIIERDPQNEKAWLGRGESKIALGRYEEAVQDLMEVVRLNPENNYAKECLKEARRKLKVETQSSAPRLNSQPQDSPIFNHAVNFSMSIPKDQLVFERALGEGSFGVVYKGVWSPTSLFNVPVAIKQLKNTSMSAKVLEDFRREVEVQAKLDSSGVVKLLGITSEQPYCMVMEFMEGGSLRDVLDSQKPEELHWEIRIQMAVNMARGLAYLHGNDPIIIHGDLKSLNILVNGNGEAKLADFGLAALKTESRSKEYVGGKADKNKGPKGSLLWIAPELFRMNAKRTPATDIFSFAVVLWELASHLFPYESAAGNEGMIREWVTTGEREAFDERTPNTPKEYSDLTQRCWDAKPENRPSAENVATELESIYSSTPLAPTMFSSGSRVSPNPVRRQSMNSGGYMANTGSGSVPVKSSSGYLVKSVVPSSQSPTASIANSITTSSSKGPLYGQ